MRILYILPAEGFGGAERQGVVHIRRLRELGHDVVPFVGPGRSIRMALEDAGVDDYRFCSDLPQDAPRPLTLVRRVRHGWDTLSAWRRASSCALEVARSAGGVDLVFANAGVGIANRVLEGEAREIAWLMNVNVIGVTNTIVPFVPLMVKQGSGVLCAVGSMAGHQPLPGRAAYSAAKACVRYFMSALRMDLHGTGVHAMTLCPGFVETALTEGQAGMMFVIDVPGAVRYMVRGIEARENTYTFPWQMNLLKEVMARVPEPVIRRLAPPARTRSSQ